MVFRTPGTSLIPLRTHTASRTRVSGGTYRTCISSGSSCTGNTGNALRTHRPRLTSVALRSGTAGIPFHSLRPYRTLIAFRARRAAFTAGRTALVRVLILTLVLALIITLILTAAAYISLIYYKNILRKYLFLQIFYVNPSYLLLYYKKIRTAKKAKKHKKTPGYG